MLQHARAAWRRSASRRAEPLGGTGAEVLLSKLPAMAEIPRKAPQRLSVITPQGESPAGIFLMRVSVATSITDTSFDGPFAV